MDANGKLGPELVPGDPNKQSKNGKVLSDIIEKHALVIGNALPQCNGKITRKRETIEGIEESAIDVVIMSPDIANLTKKILIDGVTD